MPFALKDRTQYRVDFRGEDQGKIVPNKDKFENRNLAPTNMPVLGKIPFIDETSYSQSHKLFKLRPQSAKVRKHRPIDTFSFPGQYTSQTSKDFYSSNQLKEMKEKLLGKAQKKNTTQTPNGPLDVRSQYSILKVEAPF